jgi:hypothetical protein
MEFSQQIFEAYLNIKFHENPSSGSRVFHADGQADGRKDEQTDMTKLKLLFAILRARLKTTNVRGCTAT